MNFTDLKNKTVLITGSTDGLGKSLANYFAMEGSIVIIHGRNETKGKSVQAEIYSQTQNDKIHYYNADFSSLQEVKELSDKIRNDYDKIDILINNAGIGAGSKQNKNRELSKDGIELRLAVNYVAHVLLTERLLPVISSDESCIINVSSVGQAPIDFSNLMLEKSYDGYRAYEQSKAAQIMYTFDLAERLQEKNICVNALHPATLMNTNMVLEWFGHSMTTIEEGKEAVLHVISEDTTGSYYNGKKLSNPIPQTYDPDARQKLREVTFDLINEFLS